MRDNGLVNETILSLVDHNTNSFLTIIPSAEEIIISILSLNKDNIAGLDEFGGFLFHIYWDIIKDDFIKVMNQFFIDDWILP